MYSSETSVDFQRTTLRYIPEDKTVQRIPVSRRRRRKGNPVPGGYKYGDLALHVGGSIESERVKCGHESRGTQPENNCAAEDQQQL
jgi:hypothetical protein